MLIVKYIYKRFGKKSIYAIENFRSTGTCSSTKMLKGTWSEKGYTWTINYVKEFKFGDFT